MCRKRGVEVSNGRFKFRTLQGELATTKIKTATTASTSPSRTVLYLLVACARAGAIAIWADERRGLSNLQPLGFTGG
jgi:hypothetical protein